MDKKQFLSNSEVESFVSWACEYLPNMKVNFNISRKGTGTIKRKDGEKGYSGPGVVGSFAGLDAIVTEYQWAAKYQYINKSGSVITVNSCDWTSTSKSLTELSDEFKCILNKGDLNEVRSICRGILGWGGDRNPSVGAWPFLNKLGDNLVDYLINARDTLDLNKADLHKLDQVSEMNAMLTKVHAFASEDGLPIYDSRVAAAIGSIIEIYRQSMHIQQIPSLLLFPATDNKNSRRVLGLQCLERSVLDPGRISRGRTVKEIRRRAHTWSSCKVRLGWLMAAIIERSTSHNIPLFNQSTILNDSLISKMHAFEGALFMIGFDVSCIE